MYFKNQLPIKFRIHRNYFFINVFFYLSIFYNCKYDKIVKIIYTQFRLVYTVYNRKMVKFETKHFPT